MFVAQHGRNRMNIEQSLLGQALATINNKTIEYLSAGLPVISSPRKGTVFRLLQENQCGLSYENSDAAGLCEAILKLSAEGELRKRLSANAKALYLNCFVAEKVYGGMAAYLVQLAASLQ